MGQTYQVAVTVEPKHQLVALLGVIIDGDQTSRFDRRTGLSAVGAAETPRATKRRVVGSLNENIIINFVVP